MSPQRGHRIIEIGAVAIEGGKLAREFSSLIDAGRKIPLQVQRIHGITDEMLRNQPKPDEVISRLRDFLGDSIIVAHNARFDVEFLRHEFNRLSLRLKNRSACTLKMSRQLYPGLSNHRLDTVYQYLFGKIETDIRRHRALDDAKMAARIWMEMVK